MDRRIDKTDCVLISIIVFSLLALILSNGIILLKVFCD